MQSSSWKKGKIACFRLSVETDALLSFPRVQKSIRWEFSVEFGSQPHLLHTKKQIYRFIVNNGFSITSERGGGGGTSYARCSTLRRQMAPELLRSQRRSVRVKPPVGAVAGHVAQRNGAVFTADPGPSMKKKKEERAVKGLGMHSGTAATRLRPAQTWSACAAEHGEQLPAWWNKPTLRGCGRSLS